MRKPQRRKVAASRPSAVESPPMPGNALSSLNSAAYGACNRSLQSRDYDADICLLRRTTWNENNACGAVHVALIPDSTA